MDKSRILFIMLLFLFFLVSCNNDATKKQNIGASSDQNFVTQTIPIESVIISSATNESVSTEKPFIVTNTVSPIVNLPNINLINEDIIVCRSIRDDPHTSIFEFFLLDFPEFNYDIDVDISDQYIKIPPISRYEYGAIYNIQFYDNNTSFIYLAYEMNNNKYSLYNYDLQNDTIRRIAHYDILSAQISPNEENIVFVTQDYRMFVTDFSGSGREYSSMLDIQGSPVFSPDSKYIAFFGDWRGQSVNNSAEDFPLGSQLYTISVNEPNNPIWSSVYDIGEVMALESITWSPDTKRILFSRKNDQKVFNICYSEENKGKCFEDMDFTYIEDISVSNDGLVVISGKTDPIDLSVCRECTMKDLDTDIFVLDMETEVFTKILDNDYAEQAPMFIQDGKYILYEASPRGTWQIFITDTTGSFNKQLTFSDESSQFKRLCIDN